jgi:hypothetical protein
MEAMKTVLKIVFVILAAFIVFKLLPIALIPAGVAMCAVALLGFVAGIALLALCSGLIGVVLGMFCVALILLLVLSPIWIPALACFALVAVIRKICARSV